MVNTIVKKTSSYNLKNSHFLICLLNEVTFSHTMISKSMCG